MSRRRSAYLVAVVAPLVFARARAECPVTLVPSDAPAPWASAVASARERLASQSSDCGSVEIAVRPKGGAVLTFTTTEGRRAERTLGSPQELGPALDALLVNVKVETPPAPPPSVSASAPPVASTAPPAPP